MTVILRPDHAELPLAPRVAGPKNLVSATWRVAAAARTAPAATTPPAGAAWRTAESRRFGPAVPRHPPRWQSDREYIASRPSTSTPTLDSSVARRHRSARRCRVALLRNDRLGVSATCHSEARPHRTFPLAPPGAGPKNLLSVTWRAAAAARTAPADTTPPAGAAWRTAESRRFGLAVPRHAPRWQEWPRVRRAPASHQHADAGFLSRAQAPERTTVQSGAPSE